VDADVRDPELGALVHNLAEELERHDPLLPVHLVARAKDAFGVAEIRAFDLHDFGEDGRAVAARGEQQPADRLRLTPQGGLDDAAGA
jgi:hypothetical protein